MQTGCGIVRHGAPPEAVAAGFADPIGWSVILEREVDCRRCLR